MSDELRDTVTLSKAEHDSLVADRQLLMAVQSTLRALCGTIDRRPDLDMTALAPGAAERWIAEGVASLPPVPPNPGAGGSSHIDRDPELAAFIRQHLGKTPLPEIPALCRDRFGPDRAPSKSAIHRYWKRCNRV